MVVSIDSIVTPRQKALLTMAARAANELIVDVVPCHCGAIEGEYCRGKFGAFTSTVHADRRTEADAWRRRNPRAWRRMKDQTFRRLVKRWDSARCGRRTSQR